MGATRALPPVFASVVIFCMSIKGRSLDEVAGDSHGDTRTVLQSLALLTVALLIPLFPFFVRWNMERLVLETREQMENEKHWHAGLGCMT